MAKLQQNRALYEQWGATLRLVAQYVPLSPNSLTVLSFVFGIGAGLSIAAHNLALTLLCVALMAVCDVLDGSVARIRGQATQFGGVLDHVLDRYAEMAILMGILSSRLVSAEWVVFSLFGIVMASYVRAKAESKPGMTSCNVGFAGRLEKMLILMSGVVLELSGLVPNTLMWAVILVGVISHITVIQRLRYSAKILSGFPE
jgi:archaetidylinositol phosphate synthase